MAKAGTRKEALHGKEGLACQPHHSLGSAQELIPRQTPRGDRPLTPCSGAVCGRFLLCLVAQFGVTGYRSP